MIVLILCVLCLACMCYLWQRSGKVSTNEAPPEPPALPGALPLIGHGLIVPRNTAKFWNFLEKLSTECLRVGGVIALFLGPSNYYFISDPDDSMTAMNTSLEKSNVYTFAKRWIGEGLLASTPQTWKRHRKVLNPMFTQKALNGFISVFNYEARRLLNNLEAKLDQGPFEYEQYLLVWSLETICHTAMGVKVREQTDENKKYVKAVNELLKIIMQRTTMFWLHNEFIFSFSGLKRRENEALDIIQRRSNEVLLKRKKIVNEKLSDVREDTADDFKPFIDHILISADKESFTDAEVIDEVNTFIVTGYDTTGHALINTLMTLGAHQEVQDKVYKELEEIFGNSDRDIDKDDLSKMVYMEAVIKETLRIYPIIPIFGRFNTTEVTLSRCTLPANSNTIVSVYAMCRHPMWGEDAHQFKPERWLNPACLPDNPNAYPVFGLGKRSCIGKTYAIMSMKTTLAHILRRFKLTSHNDKLAFKMEIVLKSATPLRLKLESRK